MRRPAHLPSRFTPQRLDPLARAKLLDGVVDRVRAAAGTRVVVFDLDGTLFDNRPRVVAILRELAEHWRGRYPEDAERCAAATVERIGYDFIENLRRLGVEDPALHERGLFFWRERFFQDPHMAHDVAIDGARAFANACYEAGAVLVYLTGRDLPNMALGSFASLRDHGFPIGVIGTELVVKPRFDIPDTEFKGEVMSELRRLGTVIAAFDNEAANNNLFLEAFPSCTSVYIDTLHAPDPPDLDPRAFVIDSFEVGE